MTKQYIYAEPDEVTAFMDTTGEVHATREDAISASIKADMRAALQSFIGDEDERTIVYLALEYLAENNLSLLQAFAEKAEWK